MGHILHNAITLSVKDERITKVVATCRSLVSLIHSSSNYRQKFVKAQKEHKLPDHQIPNDVSTRWGSKLKMLRRIKEQIPAINSVFLEDRKYRHLSIGWENADTIDAILHGLDGFEVLTDLLSGENQVTISSALPTLRHVDDLCSPNDQDGEISENWSSLVFPDKAAGEAGGAIIPEDGRDA